MWRTDRGGGGQEAGVLSAETFILFVLRSLVEQNDGGDVLLFLVSFIQRSLDVSVTYGGFRINDQTASFEFH